LTNPAQPSAMRSLTLALTLAALGSTALSGAALAASMGVPLDQAVIVTLSAPAHDVVVGNPAIADVTVSDQRHLVVTGKTSGVTNLVVNDMAGRIIFSRQIVVSSSSGDRVAMIQGPQITSYACAPMCQQVGAAQGLSAGAGGGDTGGAGAPVAPAGNPGGGIQASPGTP
jgi:hypothetical protein